MAADRSPSLVQRAKPWLVLAALAGALALFFALGLQHVLTFERLGAERARLNGLVAADPVLATLGLTLLYAVVTLLSLPVGTVMTLAIGFLLGTVWASAVVVVGATLGATGLFLLARSAFGERWRPPVQRVLNRLDSGFRDNAFQYLLVLRLMPVMPFWLLNIVPAFVGLTLRQYVLATFFGILPGTVVYCSVGAGLDTVFARGEVPGLDQLRDPALILPLVGLAVLAALPLVYKRLRGGGSTPPPTLPTAAL
ncbi:MAG: TVP38/TMEM64 family protein [Alphaproteobacteria bacterium]|nr:TVP38/TMEM64 family protein [Alphaproteobacteria bacterium]MCB9927980.1 TVP38/TMEM64 family protein [Alphaproteobacteria bacterium]